ncbi:hypothetical protein K7W42_16980 [Deinococcus sp. HMF7604]|uniref:hypothetical protein n=1 Tax=Deinococcus betulae TaxID=2873312 RepID=UPI001CC92531|nr:hypothetical protein [Deinococcus betulae]MBZ9752545.1 hypothetical protein [Deinococcus betulae]
MIKPGLLFSLALLPLLASCAPLTSMLASQDGPVPRSAGPLTVGQTWTVSGPVSGRTVTTTINVRDLVEVAGSTASVGGRDQADAFARAQAGFGVATYNNDRRTLNFEWIGEQGERYVCTIDTLLSLPYAGRLTLKQGGNTATGSCQATLSQP